MSDVGPTLHEALLAFNLDVHELDLKETARGGHANYLPLDGAMGQIRPLLAKHGLYPTHSTGRLDEKTWWVATRIVHAATGDSITSGPFPLVPTKNDAQGWGGALTYGRRYTLMAVLGLVGDKDDDGSGNGRQRRARTEDGKITAAQRNELMAAVREAKVPIERVKEIVKREADVDNSADIPKPKFTAVLDAIQKEKP